MDSLMSDLSSLSTKSNATFKVAPSAASANSGSKAHADELDSLMDSLGGSSTTTTRSKNAGNDLDALMSSLSSPVAATGDNPQTMVDLMA
ncbi:MAG: hypothetical protein EOP84_36025 [Verrucomicrobiaceae bacterium]|nr:MAG: hypothetical protein EOP84_36025 [Verrucomicrobiaceae bacterium]